MRIENGILYDVYNTDINADGSFVVPDSIRSIDTFAFSNCSGLTSVTIPDSVTCIGEYAFNGCSGLTSVIIPESVTSIEEGAFGGCSGLSSITVPNSVTKIGEGAFYSCYRLKTIVIGKGVVSIGDDAFCECSKLKSKPDNYKAFSLTETGKLVCRDKTYTVGKKSMTRGELKPCHNGIHYCTNLFDIFNYYCGEYGKDFVIGICDVSKENIGGVGDSKRCARWIKPTKILTREEVLKIMNGDKNDESKDR